MSIRAASTIGNFTTAAGDEFSMGSLYRATAPAGQAVAGYKVALRSDQAAPNDGKLMLRGVDVTGQADFTPAEFDFLHFAAGPSGSRQDLVVVAQLGKRAADGTLRDVIDSPAVQITASVTGTRSINAAGALLTTPAGADGAFLRTAMEASLFTGTGASSRPGLTTVGNFTTAAGDELSMGSLYKATAPAGQAVAGYKVALRSDQAAPNDGRLMLRGVDVTGQADFTPAEFDFLHFVAGPSGSRQDLVVVAQLGVRGTDGRLKDVVDSPAVQITASVTGIRSINAAGALLTDPTGADATFMRVAREASLFTGNGPGTQPGLATVGNFTATSGDEFSVGSLYAATAPAGRSVAGYKVALRSDPAAPGDGRLMLRGVDVTGRVDFTPAEFDFLHFVAGPSGSRQDMVVVAQLGTRGTDGTLRDVIDSPAVQVGVSVTGTRSINAAGALLTAPTGADAAFMRVAMEASITAGAGPRPELATAGNFTAAAGDELSLGSLYAATAPAGRGVAGYKVALRSDPGAPGDGKLMLRGVDVTGRVSFTPEEFDFLHFVAGSAGSKQDLVVAAQLGTRGSDGALTNVASSPAVQITASVTGLRSINAAAALLTNPAGADRDFLRTATEAGILAGIGPAARPVLTTVGNFTAAAGDELSLGSLYQAAAPAGQAVAGYKVALRSDPAAPGRLMLRGADVTARVDFTPDEFDFLHFVAGPAGSRQDLVVVAQLGRRGSDGTLRDVVDSLAVQIGADVTGTRSINAAAALLTNPTGPDGGFLRTVMEAELFGGAGPGSRPRLDTVVDPSEPQVAPGGLSDAVGAYQSTERPGSSPMSARIEAYDIAPLLAGGVGGTDTSGAVPARDGNPAFTPWLLSASELGGFQAAGGRPAQRSFAVLAYQATQRF